MSVADILKSKFPLDVVDALIAAYKEIESNFVTKKWKASALDAGHFVEASRRLLEHALFGTHTPLSKSISKFSDSELKRYENASGDESFRIIIPRALFAVYTLRNKRGVGHLGGISPNEMDATYILYTTKWVLAELVRLSSSLATAESQALVESIIERRLSVLWKHDGITRVLASGASTREKVLILLYDASPQDEESLCTSVEYRNSSNFRRILQRLHKDDLVHFVRGHPVLITPKGMVEAEELILGLKHGA